eukprot:PhF_6_TR882/c5_g1_i1/m.1322
MIKHIFALCVVLLIVGTQSQSTNSTSNTTTTNSTSNTTSNSTSNTTTSNSTSAPSSNTTTNTTTNATSAPSTNSTSNATSAPTNATNAPAPNGTAAPAPPTNAPAPPAPAPRVLACTRQIPEVNAEFGMGATLEWTYQPTQDFFFARYTIAARYGWAGIGFRAPGAVNFSFGNSAPMMNSTIVHSYLYTNSNGGESQCVRVKDGVQNMNVTRSAATIVDNLNVTLFNTSVARVNNEQLVVEFSFKPSTFPNFVAQGQNLLIAYRYSQSRNGLSCPDVPANFGRHSVRNSTEATKPANIILYGHSWTAWDNIKDCSVIPQTPAPNNNGGNNNGNGNNGNGTNGNGNNNNGTNGNGGNNGPQTAPPRPTTGFCAGNFTEIVPTPACQNTSQFATMMGAISECECSITACMTGKPAVKNANGKCDYGSFQCSDAKALSCLASGVQCQNNAVAPLNDTACGTIAKDYISQNTCSKVLCDRTGFACQDNQYTNACFPTAAPPVVTTTPEPPSAEDMLCDQALLGLANACPGFASLANLSMTPSQSLLAQICPCVSGDTSKYDDKLFTASMYCGTEIISSLLVVDTLFCSKSPSTGLYCGSQFQNFSNTLMVVDDFFSKGKFDNSLTQQSTIQGICNDCADQFVLGAYTLFGDVAASLQTPTCDDQCDKENQALAQQFHALSAASLVCLRNDNKNQADEPFCFPYVYRQLRSIGQSCQNRSASQCENHANGECVLYQNKCYGVGDLPIGATGEALPPPLSLINKFCENNCFYTVQGAILDKTKFENDISSQTGINRRVRRTNRRARTLQQPGSSFSVPANDATFGDVASDIDSMSQLLCLSNAKGSCFVQYLNMTAPPTGCEVDAGTTWFTNAPTCAPACAANFKALSESFGCCMGTFTSISNAIDPTYTLMPNFLGIASACNVTLASQCDAFGSAPVPVTTKVSGNCDWLLANASNVESLKNGTAKALGVPANSLKNFAVTGSDGQPCKKSTTLHRRRGYALQAASTLTANFAVVSRDNTTAQRIAASANSTAITVPTVQKAAAQTTTTAKNQVVAKTAPTVAPKTPAPNNSTPAPTVVATPAPTAIPTPSNGTTAPTTTPSPTNATATIAPNSAMSTFVSLLAVIVAAVFAL